MPILELPEPPIWIMDRKESRRPLDIRLAVESSGLQAVTGRTRDLSDGGFGATFTRPMRLGEILWVSFLFGQQKMRVEAVVRYVRGFRHGLEFRGLSRSEKLQLWKLCRQDSSKPSLQ